MAEDTKTGSKLFSTKIGWCGISWNDQGVTRFVLPQENKTTVRRELSNESDDSLATPTWVGKAIDSITAHLAGEPSRLTQIPIDLSVHSSFRARIYEKSRKIPNGTTISYGELATLAGNPKGARACGSAMAKNPVPLLVPCHRVVPATGKLGNFSSYGGVQMKQKLLEIEGASF